MYKNQYISELPINEVKEYFDKLRCKFPLTAEKSADYAICKERLVVYACKTLEQINVLNKIRADVINIADGKQSIKVRSVLRIIDKHKAESEAAE